MKAKRLTRGGDMRRARREKGLTMVDLGEKSGVCVASLAHWERDMCSPTLESLELVAHALGLSLDEYVGFPERMGGEKK